MALSNPAYTGWDFTSASTPYASKYGSVARTLTPSGTPTIGTTNGLELRASKYAEVTVGSGFHPFTSPLTIIIIGKALNTGSASQTPIYSWRDSGGSARQALRFTGDSGAWNALVQAGVYSLAGGDASTNDAILVAEMRTNGGTIYDGDTGGSLSSSGSSTAESLTWSGTGTTTDLLRVGDSDGVNPGFNCYGFAVCAFALTAGDRTALAADWRAALASAVRRPTSLISQRARKRTISRIVTRTWAGPPTTFVPPAGGGGDFFRTRYY